MTGFYKKIPYFVKTDKSDTSVVNRINLINSFRVR